MSGGTWSRESCGGFTLIEVIAALVIFSVGVLMVIQLSGSLSRQMEYAARTSELVVRAHERIDSIEALPFDSISTGTATESLTVEGVPYSLKITVAPLTAVLLQVDVEVDPVTAGAGPSYSATSYVAAPW